MFVRMQSTLHGTYDTPLVIASVVVASLASYVALVLASRVIAARGRLRQAWLVAGAMAMGIGIWAMHFVGMLAFRLDGLPIAYDVPRLGLSVLVAVAASGFALWVVSLRGTTWWYLVTAAVAMGAAIAGMHYIGMAGLHTAAALTLAAASGRRIRSRSPSSPRAPHSAWPSGSRATNLPSRSSVEASQRS